MSQSESFDGATSFNNAGVVCYRAGDHKKAWELFKGALELKLALERLQATTLDNDSSVLMMYSGISRSNQYVARAERLYQSVEPVDPSDTSSKHEDTDGQANLQVSRSPLLSALHRQFGGEHGDVFYSPSLCTKPFMILESHDLTQKDKAKETSAIVIYNLALVEHIFNRSSRQAVSLYELASSLAVGERVGALGVALVNNIGVWCFENDDVDSAQRCMGHLSKLLLKLPVSQQTVQEIDHSEIQLNVHCMLTPRGSTSPAA